MPIIRKDINEEWAHSGYIKAGDFIFLNYCVGNIGKSTREQFEGAFNEMERRLNAEGYSLENVVKIDVLMRDVWDIPIMEKVIKKRFKGNYPARKTIQTEFAHVSGENGLKVQIDGIAYIGK